MLNLENFATKVNNQAILWKPGHVCEHLGIRKNLIENEPPKWQGQSNPWVMRWRGVQMVEGLLPSPDIMLMGSKKKPLAMSSLNNGLVEQRMKKIILLMKGELRKHQDCVKCIFSFFLHNVETLLLSAMRYESGSQIIIWDVAILYRSYHKWNGISLHGMVVVASHRINH